MTTFQICVLIGMGAIAYTITLVAFAIDDLRKELKEIWQRMPRID